MIVARSRPFARCGIALSVLVVALLVVLVSPRAARAQDLTDNIKTSSNVGPFADQIQRFVNEQVKALSGNDPAAQSQAREALVRQVQPPPAAGGGAAPAGSGPSQAFLNHYAEVLNTALVPLAQHKDTRVRLNAAIVAAKVSEHSRNAKLLPVTQALLKDASDGVVLWALRAARHLLPATVAGGGDALIPAIVAIGQARPSVIGYVHEALAVNVGAQPATLQPKVVSAVVPAMQTVLQSRVNQYKNTIPSDPPADRTAAAYLTASNEYRLQSAQQRAQTAQLLSDLIHVAAQRYADANTEQRQQVLYLIQGVGGAFAVIGMPQWENNPQLQSVGTAISRLNRSATPEQVNEAVGPLFETLKQIPKFAKLTAPPQVGEMVANPGTTPPPATASTMPGEGR